MSIKKLKRELNKLKSKEKLTPKEARRLDEITEELYR